MDSMDSIGLNLLDLGPFPVLERQQHSEYLRTFNNKKLMCKICHSINNPGHVLSVVNIFCLCI